MTEKTGNFTVISEKVIDQLRRYEYSETTIVRYRRNYARLSRYLDEKGYGLYSPSIGEEYLETLSYLKHEAYVSQKCAIRRINDCLYDRDFSYAEKQEEPSVPVEYCWIRNEYLEQCISNGNKELTLYVKKRVVSAFLNFLHDNNCLDISEVTPQLVEKVLCIYNNEDSYAIIKNFLRYVYNQEIITKDYAAIVPIFRRKKKLPSVYSLEEIIKIEGAIDTETDKGKRDLLMIRLITRMGLRVGDVAKLKWSEIDIEHSKLSIIQQKTGNPLSLVMPRDVALAYKLYIENGIKEKHEDEYVFHSLCAPHNRVTTTLIRHSLTSYIHKAGINISGRKHGPHAFRASLASSMVNDNVSYEVVRKVLGHTDPNVILRYARTDIEKLRMCAIVPPEPTGLFEDFLNGRRKLKNV